VTAYLGARTDVNRSTHRNNIAMNFARFARLDTTEHCNGGITHFPIHINISANRDSGLADFAMDLGRSSDHDDRFGGFSGLEHYVLAEFDQHTAV
jgi:hypothetical protein